MDFPAPTDDDANDYVSDSNSESSESDYDLYSNEDSDFDSDTENGTIDFTVPDMKSNPPSWTDDVQTITVPPFKFTGGPTLPHDFNVNTTCPIDYFKLVFTDAIIEHIVKCTNDYARIQITNRHRTKPDYVDPQWSLDGSDNLTCEELRTYIGCCVIISVNPARQLRHIFSSEPYLNNMGIRNIFTLRRFTRIGHYFCVSVKSLEPPSDSNSFDKMYKIRPIVEHLNKVFPRYYHYGAHVVLDESTVAMRSRDNCCQYCPQKPCKWGWKVWLLCDSEYIDRPYLLSFSPYLGKKNTTTSKYGLYFDVVQQMTKFMRGSNVKLYTDSAFSSL